MVITLSHVLGVAAVIATAFECEAAAIALFGIAVVVARYTLA